MTRTSKAGYKPALRFGGSKMRHPACQLPGNYGILMSKIRLR